MDEGGESRGQAAVRATAFLRWLWGLAANTVACVTHGGYLDAALLQPKTQPIEMDEAALACPSGWANVELRAYRVTSLGGDGDDLRLRFELLHRVAAAQGRAASLGPALPKLQSPAEVIEHEQKQMPAAPAEQSSEDC